MSTWKNHPRHAMRYVGPPPCSFEERLPYSPSHPSARQPAYSATRLGAPSSAEAPYRLASPDSCNFQHLEVLPTGSSNLTGFVGQLGTARQTEKVHSSPPHHSSLGRQTRKVNELHQRVPQAGNHSITIMFLLGAPTPARFTALQGEQRPAQPTVAAS